MKRALMVVMTLAVFLLLGGVGAAAGAEAGFQTTATGTIQGQALDQEGLPLPGVIVTASGPALIGERVTYSTASGTYRFTLLPPGTYRLTFRLQGFATVEREDVEVGVRRVTTVSVGLKLASVEETVVVTGRSPMVDVKTTKRSSEYSDELRNMLPETRGNGVDMLSLSPEGSPPSNSRTDLVGVSFFGSPSLATAFQVDGVNVTDPRFGGQFPYYSPDWFETIEITPTGGGAEFGKAMGAVFNVVTKSGGNQFHGETNFFFQNDAFLDDNTENITSEVVDFTSPELDYRYDFSANLGGPVVRDKSWFFVGYQGFYQSERNAGAQIDAVRNADRFFGKLTWQVNPDNRLIGSMMADTLTDQGPSNPLFEPEAAYHFPSYNLTPNITWNSVFSANSFLEVKYSGFYGYFDLVPISDGPASIELFTGVVSDAYFGLAAIDRARTHVQANLSHYADDFAGQHAFRFGAGWERLVSDERFEFGANEQGTHILYYTFLGEPYFAYTYEPSVNRDTSLAHATTLYAQDDWTVTDRLTLNLGLRFDHWDIGYIDAKRPDEPTFDDLSPRIGVNFDLMGDGRAALHAFYGRFYEEAHGAAFNQLDPKRADGVGWFWNGIRYVEVFRVNPVENRAIDPELSNVYSDQLTAGLDYQLREDLAISAKYVRKRDSDILGHENVGNDYVPITVVNDDGEAMTIWAADPFYDPFFVLVNNPSARFPHVGDLFRNYNGFQIKLNKRLADDWALIGSFIVQKATGNAQNNISGHLAFRGTFDSPNDFVNTPGELRNSRRHVFKLQGSWLTPDPIRTLIGFQLDAASSARRDITERFRFLETGGLPASDRTVPIRTIGSETIEPIVNLNLRLEKQFALRGAWGDFGVVFDVFNVFNADTVTSIRQRVPLHGDPRAIVDPRTYRLGVRWLF